MQAVSRQEAPGCCPAALPAFSLKVTSLVMRDGWDGTWGQGEICQPQSWSQSSAARKASPWLNREALVTVTASRPLAPTWEGREEKSRTAGRLWPFPDCQGQPRGSIVNQVLVSPALAIFSFETLREVESLYIVFRNLWCR